MHIANVVWMFPRMTETFIMYPLLELERRGHELWIYATKDPRISPASEDSMPEDALHDRLSSSQMLMRTVYELDMTVLIRRISPLADVVIFHWSDCLFTLLEMSPLPYPVVLCCHEPDFSRHFLPLFLQHQQAVLQRITSLVVEALYQQEQLLTYGFPRERVTIWQAGVDISGIDRMVKEYPLVPYAHTPFRLVSAGRFVPKKGFLQAIDAVKLLYDHGYAIHYALYGDGILLPALLQRIQQHSLEHVVSVCGKQMHPQLYALFLQADLLLAPSMMTSNDQEGIMSTLLEAMACFLPIVSTMHGGTPEIVQHKQTGILLSENTPVFLAESIEQIINYPLVWQSLRVNGAAAVRRTHDLSPCTDLFETIIARAITQKR